MALGLLAGWPAGQWHTPAPLPGGLAWLLLSLASAASGWVQDAGVLMALRAAASAGLLADHCAPAQPAAAQPGGSLCLKLGSCRNWGQITIPPPFCAAPAHAQPPGAGHASLTKAHLHKRNTASKPVAGMDSRTCLRASMEGHGNSKNIANFEAGKALMAFLALAQSMSPST